MKAYRILTLMMVGIVLALALDVASSQRLHAATEDSVSINDGAATTRSRSVTLTLISATGSSFHFSFNGGSTWSPWAPLVATKKVSLPAGDGEKTVSVQYKDNEGHVSEPCSDTIILDMKAPVNGTLTATSLADNQIRLDWGGFSDAVSGLAGYRLVRGTKRPANCAGAPIATPALDASSYTDTGVEGTTYFYRLCGVDQAGNVGTGVFASARAIPEFTKPTGSLAIKEGDYATKKSVTLSLAATDASGVAAYCISNTDKCTSWKNLTPVDPLPPTEIRWNLAAGAVGPRTVKVWFRDRWGNVSDPASDDIILDTVVPKGSILINGKPVTNSAVISLTLSATDVGTGVARMRFSFDGKSWVEWVDFDYSCDLTLPAGEGNRTVHAQFQDKAGNLSRVVKDSIRLESISLDTVSPTGSIVINKGANTTNDPLVTLTLAAADTGGSGVKDMRLAIESGGWGEWVTYAGSRQVTLSSGAGEKVVAVQYRDGAGNVSEVYNDSITVSSGGLGLVLEPYAYKAYLGGPLETIFTMQKPKGWEVTIAGMCSTLAFLIQDPKEPLNQIFYFGEIYPVYVDQGQKNADLNICSYYPSPCPISWTDAPVVNPFTVANFFAHWPQIAAMKNATSFMAEFPHLTGIEIISSLDQSPMMGSGSKTALVRGAFSNGDPLNPEGAQGQFLASVLADIFGGKGGGFVVFGVTAPTMEFKANLAKMVESLNNFTMTDTYINWCMVQQGKTWDAIAKIGETLRETSDIVWQGWQQRTAAQDVMAYKYNDSVRGVEKVWDPGTGKVYEFSAGFYDQYKLNPGAYNISTLESMPEGRTDLWEGSILNGPANVHPY